MGHHQARYAILAPRRTCPPPPRPLWRSPNSMLKFFLEKKARTDNLTTPGQVPKTPPDRRPSPFYFANARSFSKYWEIMSETTGDWIPCPPALDCLQRPPLGNRGPILQNGSIRSPRAPGSTEAGQTVQGVTHPPQDAPSVSLQSGEHQQQWRLIARTAATGQEALGPCAMPPLCIPPGPETCIAIWQARNTGAHVLPFMLAAHFMAYKRGSVMA